MKKYISFDWGTPEHILLGIEYIEGEAEDIVNGDVYPCQMLSIGFLFFSININFV